MKKIICTTVFICSFVFSVVAQTSEEIYSIASKSVQNKIDENKKNSLSPLAGINAVHIFKIKKPDSLNIADLNVYIVEGPGMINFAMNLTRSWSRVKSVEFECPAFITLDQIKSYFSKFNVIIAKDKVNYIVQL